MINFFRKIRQNHLAQSRFGKYLPYALGEIALVIIGILIALSINNWNEERKVKHAEQSLLKDLRTEVAANLEALDEVIMHNQSSLEAATEIKALFKDRDAYNAMPDSSFSRLRRKMDVNWTYDPRNGILNSMISSGQINNLSNKELKYMLASFKDIVKDAFETTMKIEQERDALLWKVMEDCYIKEDGMIVGFDSRCQFDHPSFRIAVNWLFVSTRLQGMDEEKELRASMEHMLELIDGEIGHE